MPKKENNGNELQNYDSDNGQWLSNKENISYNRNGGYVGSSMSVRAKEAYEQGEKPLSKWSKSDIISGILSANSNIDKDLLSKMSISELKNNFLSQTSWHHTGSFFNETNFYSLNDSAIDELTNDELEKKIQRAKESIEESKRYESQHKQEQEERKLLSKYKGDISFTEWGGSRNHPTPIQRTMTNVSIEKKGDYYVIMQEDGSSFRKKAENVRVNNKTYDNKTQRLINKEKAVIKQELAKDKEEKFNEYKKLSNDKEYAKQKALEIAFDTNIVDKPKGKTLQFLDKMFRNVSISKPNLVPTFPLSSTINGVAQIQLNGGKRWENPLAFSNDYESSRSGHYYLKGRKPNSFDYDNLSKFFKKGEHRLEIDRRNETLNLQEWNGKDFETIEKTKIKGWL